MSISFLDSSLGKGSKERKETNSTPWTARLPLPRCKYVKETNDPVWLKGINIPFQQTAIDEIGGQTAGIMGPSSTDPISSSPKSLSPSPVRPARKASEGRPLNTLHPISPFVSTATLEAVGESTKDTAADLDLPWLNALRNRHTNRQTVREGPTNAHGQTWTMVLERRIAIRLDQRAMAGGSLVDVPKVRAWISIFGRHTQPLG